MKALVTLLIFTVIGCSQQSETNTSASKISGKQTARGASRPEQAKALLMKSQDLMDFNMIRGELFPEMGLRTVLEHHESVFPTEELQASGGLLEYYLVYIRCLQGLRYMRNGLFSSVEIGHFVREMKDFDERIFQDLLSCAERNPKIRDRQNQSFNLNGDNTLIESAKRGVGFVFGFQSASAAEVEEDYSGLFCQKIAKNICEAHELASLEGGRSCKPLPFKSYVKLEPDSDLLKWPFTDGKGKPRSKTTSELAAIGFDCE